MVVWEQAAGASAFSAALAWAGTLRGEERVGRGELTWYPQASHSQPYPVPWGRGLRGTQEPPPSRRLVQKLWGDSVLGEDAGCIQRSPSPAPSAPEAPKWRCPQWRSGGGSWDDATPASVGPRTPGGSGWEDSSGLRKLARGEGWAPPGPPHRTCWPSKPPLGHPSPPHPSPSPDSSARSGLPTSQGTLVNDPELDLRQSSSTRKPALPLCFPPSPSSYLPLPIWVAPTRAPSLAS